MIYDLIKCSAYASFRAPCHSHTHKPSDRLFMSSLMPGTDEYLSPSNATTRYLTVFYSHHQDIAGSGPCKPICQLVSRPASISLPVPWGVKPKSHTHTHFARRQHYFHIGAFTSALQQSCVSYVCFFLFLLCTEVSLLPSDSHATLSRQKSLIYFLAPFPVRALFSRPGERWPRDPLVSSK